MSASHEADTFSLVADIGGTNTRVALAIGPDLQTETITRYRNAEYSDLESVLRQYVSEQGDVDCRAASVALAGPVRDGKGALTNLDWAIDTETLARATKAETAAVLNDLQAQGHALGRIDVANIQTVLPGAPARSDATKLVVGVGTGFNAAVVLETPHGREVPPSEAGHMNLPLNREDETALSDFLRANHGFAAVEDALSGRGLEHLYAWLSHKAGSDKTEKAAEIVASCAAGSDPQATEAVSRFAGLLGTVVGNLALIHLPFGGIFLVGGVARAIAPYFDAGGFGAAFRAKGRFAEFMDDFPLSVVVDDFAALTGSAAYLHALDSQSGESPTS